MQTSFLLLFGFSILCFALFYYTMAVSHLPHLQHTLATSLSLVYVTAPDVKVAKELSHGLIAKKLAACVNIVPGLTSIYEWENKVQEDSEVLMLIKTRTSRVPELTTHIRESHPYKVCEVISTDITSGNQPYLDWILQSVHPSRDASSEIN